MKVIDQDGKKRDIEVFIEKVPSGGGSPKKVLTEEGCKLVENLSRILCTEEEIAQILETSLDTLLNKNNKELFRGSIERGRAQGKQSLRRMQYQVAMKGNVKMLIWLGKQVLGQTEKIDTNVNTNENATMMREFLNGVKNGEYQQSQNE